MTLKTTLGSLLVAALVATAAPALASGDVDPALKERVTAEMTAQGYEVRKVQMEDGMIEVYAVKDGKAFELYLDDALKIVKSKQE